MSARPVIAAAALGLLSAAPAQAVILPVCDARLVHAAAGTVGRCNTDNTPMVAGATVYRTVTVEVAEGVAQATLRCGYGAYERSDSVTVSGAEPGSVSMYEDTSPSCRVELTAVYPSTTAVATSTFSYAFIGPVT